MCVKITGVFKENSNAGTVSQTYYIKITEWNAPFRVFFFFQNSLDILNCTAKFENYCPDLKDRGSIVMDEGETFEGQHWREQIILTGKRKKEKRISRRWYSPNKSVGIQKCMKCLGGSWAKGEFLIGQHRAELLHMEGCVAESLVRASTSVAIYSPICSVVNTDKSDKLNS